MEENKKEVKIRIAGMGALGVMYGDFIKEQGGDISFVMDKQRLEKYRGQEVLCNGRSQIFQMEESSQASPADLVIVAVKYGGLQSVIETNQLPRCKHSSTVLGSYVAAHSTCLSLLLPQARKRGMRICLYLLLHIIE